MSDNKTETWTIWVALSLSIMAVVAGVVTLYMGKYSSRTALLQGQITNQWSYYQAKSIKQHAYEIQKQNLELQLAAQRCVFTKSVQQQFDKTIELDASNITRYGAEKDDIKKQAEAMEADKLLNQQRSGKLSIALIFLQIAIMLSSVTLITKRRPLWYVGSILALCGGYFAIVGIFLTK